MGDDHIDLNKAREVIYGEAYEAWKAKYQSDAKVEIKDAGLNKSDS